MVKTRLELGREPFDGRAAARIHNPVASLNKRADASSETVTVHDMSGKSASKY